MKAISIERSDVTREKLLALAEEAPGAWLGLKVAVLVLLLDGYRPTFLCQPFGLSRMSLTRWVHRVNQEGVTGVLERPRSGRPTALTARLRRQLLRHLEQSPEQHGLPRAVWDGPTLMVHLRRRFGVELTVRQAQKWLHRLGYRLKRGSYVFLQARAQDAARFRQRLKKLRHWTKRDVVVFEDETGFTEHPRISRVWARGGQPFRVPTTSNHRRRLDVFG